MTDAPLPLRLFGVEFAVTVPPERRDIIATQWEWCTPQSPMQRDIAPLSRPGAPLENHGGGRSSDGHARPLEVARAQEIENPDAADYTLTTTLTGRAIAARAGELVMLHAGGVSHPRTGVVAGLVAASGTGKTTATRHFCSHGYGYVTDESLIVNDARHVMPYPKPLSVLADPNDPGVKKQHSPRELGLAEPPPGTLVLGPIILLDRVRDTPTPGTSDDAPRLTQVPLFEGIIQILPQSSAMPQIPDCLDLLARLLAAGGGALMLRYREITQADDVLEEAFAAEPVEPFWRHVPGTWSDLLPVGDRYAAPAGAPDAPNAFAAQGRVALTPFVDALIDDDGLDALVLFGSTPARLQGLGAVVFDALATGPQTVDHLLARCTDVLGEHPDAAQLLDDALHQLADSGILLDASDA